MKTNETIEELLNESANLEYEQVELSNDTHELPEINPDPAERRNFSRAEVLDRNLSLDFLSGAQFAKHYIENISLGGLFVRTDQKAAIGEIIPIKFSVPSPTGEERIFNLKGRVCRVAAHGLGLEFTNLSQKARAELETFVKSVLPQGVSVTAKAKASTIERLDQRRAEVAKKQASNKKLRSQIMLILCGLALNAWMTHRYLETTSEEKIRMSVNPSLTFNGQTFSASTVKAVEKKENDQWLLHLMNGSSVQVTSKQLEGQLPAHLQQSVETLKHLHAPKSPRFSKNSPKLTRLR